MKRRRIIMFYAITGTGVLILAAAVAMSTPSMKASQGRFDTEEQTTPRHSATATFAGGCFWCMEPPFEKLEGVIDVVSGYTGGHSENPTYETVCSGTTGHLEAVQVTFDPERIGYEELLQVFWRQIDPTDPGGQFADRGSQYGTAIFYRDEEQRKLAEQSKQDLEAGGFFFRPIVTSIRPAERFYAAEEEHQNYYQSCPVRYKLYRAGSGRKAFLKNLWGGEQLQNSNRDSEYPVPKDDQLKQLLTPLQFQVTRQEATEQPFQNEYWDNHREGLYVDIISGEPLFSSRDKYDSKTGWPSFTRPLSDQVVREREDRRLGMTRREVRAARSDSHLGHVFPDGPEPTGLRYCMNSAALRFVPREDLANEGYGRYESLFED